MRKIMLAAAVMALVAIGLAAKPKLKPTVAFAPSWEAAVGEAKLLNLPIVVHSHGFY